MRITEFFLAGLSWQTRYAWWIRRYQRIQRRFDFFQTCKVVEAIGPGSNFSNCLWAAEHQDAHYGHDRPSPIHLFIEDVTILGHARLASIDHVNELLFS